MNENPVMRIQRLRRKLDEVLAAHPDVLNHNLETVPRLYPQVRPQADYQRSLDLLATTARFARDSKQVMKVKSGLMVGLGEKVDEIKEVLDDLKRAGCELVTIGQYIQPRRDLLPVTRYLDTRSMSHGKARVTVVSHSPGRVKLWNTARP